MTDETPTDDEGNAHEEYKQQLRAGDWEEIPTHEETLLIGVPEEIEAKARERHEAMIDERDGDTDLQFEDTLMDYLDLDFDLLIPSLSGAADGPRNHAVKAPVSKETHEVLVEASGGDVQEFVRQAVLNELDRLEAAALA